MCILWLHIFPIKNETHLRRSPLQSVETLEMSSRCLVSPDKIRISLKKQVCEESESSIRGLFTGIPTTFRNDVMKSKHNIVKIIGSFEYKNIILYPK